MGTSSPAIITPSPVMRTSHTSITSAKLVVAVQATSRLWPRDTPMDPARVKPATSKAPSAWALEMCRPNITFGLSRARCGSLATSERPLAVCSGRMAMLLLPTARKGARARCRRDRAAAAESRSRVVAGRGSIGAGGEAGSAPLVADGRSPGGSENTG